jgi:hypothetical protein
MIRRSTLILLLLFAISIGIYFYLDKNPIKTDVNATPTPPPVLFPEIQFDQVASVKYFGLKKEVIQLDLAPDNNWKLISENNLPVEWAVVEDLVSTISDINIQNKLPSTSSEEILGISSNSARIEIGQKNGSTLIIWVGNLTPTSNGYYIKTTDGTIYIVDRYTLDIVLDKLTRSSITGTPDPTNTPEPSRTATPTPLPGS